MKMILDSHSPEDTSLIGSALGQILVDCPATLLMTGDLGAGKTTISKAIAVGMGIDELVTSPTFALINRYGEAEQVLYHLDLYRLQDLDELTEIGFDELVEEGASMIIEWPQIVDDYPFERRLTLSLERINDGDDRCITIETEDADLIRRLEAIG